MTHHISYRRPEETPIESIIIQPQVRQHFDETEFAGLVNTIKHHGIHQPLIVYAEGEKLILIAGERRLRAAQTAGLKTVPVQIIPRPLRECQILEIQLIENFQRSDLLPLEKAKGIQRWIEASKATASDAAVKLGLSNGTVTKLLALLSLPESIQAEVQAGKIGLTAAYKLSQIKDAGQQAELAARIVGGQLTRDRLVESVRAAQKPTVSCEKTPKRATIALGGGRAVTVAGQGITLETLIAWLDELVAKAKKARSQRLEFKTFLKVLRDQAQQEASNA